jgi:lysozyme
MQLGMRGTALIESFEQLRLTAYPGQEGKPTIGWGHTGPEVRLGMTCTREQADAWFVQDTHTAVVGVQRTITATLTQNQFDALVAFTFNVGTGAESHATIVRLVNAGNMDAAALEFAKWNHVNGVVSDGLTRRRAAEHDLFVSP